MECVLTRVVSCRVGEPVLMAARHSSLRPTTYHTELASSSAHKWTIKLPRRLASSQRFEREERGQLWEFESTGEMLRSR